MAKPYSGIRARNLKPGGKRKAPSIELRQYLRNGRALVAKETFAIVKTNRTCAGAFAVIRDRRETSCVIDEAKLPSQRFLGLERGWRLVTFDMTLPFSLIGFFAAISRALADERIGLLAISSYSTDHIFVKDKDLDRAGKALGKLGINVVRL